MKMFFGRLPVVQDGNCNSPWICEPSWEHWELFPEPLLQPFTTLFFTWHSPASPSLPLSWQPHSTSMPCLSLCRSAWLELAYSTLWLPFGKGRAGVQQASWRKELDFTGGTYWVTRLRHQTEVLWLVNLKAEDSTCLRDDLRQEIFRKRILETFQEFGRFRFKCQVFEKRRVGIRRDPLLLCHSPTLPLCYSTTLPASGKITTPAGFQP